MGTTSGLPYLITAGMSMDERLGYLDEALGLLSNYNVDEELQERSCHKSKEGFGVS